MRLGADLGWRAELALRFAACNGRTNLVERKHVGPLLVQRPFHPEGAPCHVYIVHPPGGIVGGDGLSMRVAVEREAHALLTTPAATKFYRSEGPVAQQVQQFSADGVLEWLPQETIFYPGARAHCSTRIDVGGAPFIGWDIPCLGLPARNEEFVTGSLRFDLELWTRGRPLYMDRLRIAGDSAARTAQWGLSKYQAIGTLLAHPADGYLLEVVRRLEANCEMASTLVDGVLVCRALAAQAEPVKQTFIRIWQSLRPMLLNRPAVLPRIWAT